MTEVVPGVHRLVAPLGDRLRVHLPRRRQRFGGGHRHRCRGALLTGPAEALAALEVDVAYILVTHADVDHSGGLAATAARAAGARRVSSARPAARGLRRPADRRAVPRVPSCPRDRPDTEFCDWVRANDDGGAVADVIVPPAHIELGDRRLAVLHTPGHTQGHLTVVDELTRTAIVADAVMASAVPDAAGEPAFAPTYRYPADYRESCAVLRRLDPERLLCSHYPVVEGRAGVAEFVDESESFAARVEQEILDVLETAARPLPAVDVIGAVAPRVRTWDASMDLTLAQPVVGHLEDLVLRRLARVLPGRPVTFVAAGPS